MRGTVVVVLIECLLTNEEMTLGPAGWSDLEDPFPISPLDEDRLDGDCQLSEKSE